VKNISKNIDSVTKVNCDLSLGVKNIEIKASVFNAPAILLPKLECVMKEYIDKCKYIISRFGS
jgi:hypothetical protein